MAKSTKTDLTTGSPTKKLLLFSLPLLLGNVFQQLYNVVDTIIVGKYIGTDALAAVGTAFPIIFLMVGLFIGLGTGANVLIAQFFGAKREEEIVKVVSTIYIITFFGSIIITAIGLIFVDDILVLLNVPDDVMVYALPYMQITFAYTAPMFGYNMVSFMMRGLGDSKTPLYFLLISSVLNVVLDLVFIINFNWGVEGAAWATFISQSVSFILIALWVHLKYPILKVARKELKFHFNLFKKILMIGIPTALQQILIALGVLTVQSLVNAFGSVVMAGYTAGGRVETFASMPLITLSTALSTFIAQNIGAGAHDRVEAGAKAGVRLSIILGLAIAVIMFFTAETFVSMFDDNPDVIAAGTTYILTLMPFYFMLGGMFAITGIMRGAGAVFVPVVMTLFAMWLIRVPTAHILVYLWNDPIGVYLAFGIGWTIGFVIAYIAYKRGKWKNKSLI